VHRLANFKFVFSNLNFNWVQELTGHHVQYVFNTFHDGLFISAVVSKIMILSTVSNRQFVIIYLV
jgi:hypothetical protein